MSQEPNSIYRPIIPDEQRVDDEVHQIGSMTWRLIGSSTTKSVGPSGQPHSLYVGARKLSGAPHAVAARGRRGERL